MRLSALQIVSIVCPQPPYRAEGGLPSYTLRVLSFTLFTGPSLPSSYFVSSPVPSLLPSHFPSLPSEAGPLNKDVGFRGTV